MIFVAETEDRSLRIFSDEKSAVSACEGLDVEAAVWLFWSSDGSPLQPVFITPNKRGLFSVHNGTYRLEPADDRHHAHLAEAIDEIRYLIPSPFFESLAAVRAHLLEGVGRT